MSPTFVPCWRRGTTTWNPPVGLHLGDPAKVVAQDPEQPLGGVRVHPLLDVHLEERNDVKLVLADEVVRLGRGAAGRLADDHEQLDRDPGLLAELSGT